jgi:hypothetical protein
MLTKLKDFPRLVVEHRLVNSKMHTNQMASGLQRKSRKSHFKKAGQVISMSGKKRKKPGKLSRL